MRRYWFAYAMVVATIAAAVAHRMSVESYRAECMPIGSPLGFFDAFSYAAPICAVVFHLVARLCRRATELA